MIFVVTVRLLLKSTGLHDEIELGLCNTGSKKVAVSPLYDVAFYLVHLSSFSVALNHSP